MKERLNMVLIKIVNIPIFIIWMLMLLTIIVPIVIWVVTGDDPEDVLNNIMVKTKAEKIEEIQMKDETDDLIRRVNNIFNEYTEFIYQKQLKKMK